MKKINYNDPIFLKILNEFTLNIHLNLLDNIFNFVLLVSYLVIIYFHLTFCIYEYDVLLGIILDFNILIFLALDLSLLGSNFIYTAKQWEYHSSILKLIILFLFSSQFKLDEYKQVFQCYTVQVIAFFNSVISTKP